MKLAATFYSPGPCTYADGDRTFVHAVPIEEGERRPNIARMEGAEERARAVKFDLISNFGFIAGGRHAALPVCRDCRRCVSLRVNMEKFKPSRNQRYTLRRNEDLTYQTYALGSGKTPPLADLHELYVNYVITRHGNFKMSKDRASFIRENLANSSHILIARDGEKIISAACVQIEGEEMVLDYIFYDLNGDRSRSLGKLSWLKALEFAAARGVKHVYIGSWVKGAERMDYKKNFSGLEAFDGENWVDFDPEIHVQGPDNRAVLARAGAQIASGRDSYPDISTLA